MAHGACATVTPHQPCVTRAPGVGAGALLSASGSQHTQRLPKLIEAAASLGVPPVDIERGASPRRPAPALSHLSGCEGSSSGAAPRDGWRGVSPRAAALRAAANRGDLPELGSSATAPGPGFSDKTENAFLHSLSRPLLQCSQDLTQCDFSNLVQIAVMEVASAIFSLISFPAEPISLLSSIMNGFTGAFLHWPLAV